MAKRYVQKNKNNKTHKFHLSYETFNNLKNNFYIGMARGIGTALGFTVLGAIVIFIMQFIPLEKIPLIGDLLIQINDMLRSRF